MVCSISNLERAIIREKTMVFCQKQAENTLSLLILTHHLKGLSLSFHKINVIGPTELKLWLLKDAATNLSIITIVWRSPQLCLLLVAMDTTETREESLKRVSEHIDGFITSEPLP